MDLRDIAAALKGDVSSGQVLAPGPGHCPKDRSLSVRLDASAPNGFRVHSFADDDWRVCREYVRNRLGLGPGTGPWRPSETPGPAPPRQLEDKSRENMADALAERRCSRDAGRALSELTRPHSDR
jgi:hypothetical protein